ncbi:MAG: alpha/beta hydrolase [Comamonadaceae bacterium]|nr:MAG: alpha/beta hydrolase [Comamonadaceae bacterium]
MNDISDPSAASVRHRAGASGLLPHGYANQEEVDRDYNPRLRAIDLEGVLGHYRQQSEAARRALPYRAGIAYGPTRAETLDIVPAERPDAPVFLYLHGGYWRANAARDFSHMAMGAHALGYTTVLVDYALCPTVTLDEIVRQVRAAAAWVLRHIAAWNGDPRRIVVGGHSAGGHLGAMLLCTPWQERYDLPDDPFAGAILVSGLFDIAPLRYSYLQPAIQLDEGLVARNSPMLRARPCRTPMVLTWGGLEQPAFERQSAGMYRAWLAAGNPAQLMPQPEADHFTAIGGFERPDSALCTAMKAMAESTRG